MNFIKNLSLRAALLISFGFVLVAAGVVGWRGISGMGDLNEALNAIYQEQFLPGRRIADANVALVAWNRATLNHVLAESTQKMDEYEGIMAGQRMAVVERLQQLSEMERVSKRGAVLRQELRHRFQQAAPVRDRVVELSRAGKQEEARQLIRTELRSIVDAMDRDMTLFLQLQEKQLEEAMKSTDERYNQAFWRILGIVGGTFVFLVLVGAVLSRKIITGMDALVRGMGEAVLQNFQQAKVNISSHDEWGYLGAGFNQMLERLEHNRLELEQVQEDLRRQEQFAVVGRLSGSIAHEIRNPLSVIDSSAYYLKMRLTDADEKTQLHLDRIRRQVDACTDIVQNMRDLTRIEAPQKARLDLADALDEGMALLSLPGEVNVVKERPEAPLLVDGDRGQLVLVFRNIVANALQAMDNNGTLWVRAGKTGEGWCEVACKDTGPGIPAEHLEKIFEPLFTTKARGMGLGLAICQLVVEKHGGTIAVQSAAGEGATFIVRLPAVETKAGDH